MRFDWVKLLRKHRIDYVERGANVKKGEVNIKCPFCGRADPSEHMGLNSEKGYWACWRDEEHRGRKPHRLIMRLLRCSFARACEIVGTAAKPVPDGFDAIAARVDRLFDSEESFPFELVMPEEFKPIRRYGAERPYAEYLSDRGFRRIDLGGLVKEYDLRCAAYGDYKGRVIFPVYLDGVLVTWTGRHIGASEVRYKALSHDESILPTVSTVFNIDKALGDRDADWLIVTEGPVDALKLDYYGMGQGVRACALMSLQVSEEQQAIIIPALDQTNVLVMMDSGGAEAQKATRFANELSFLGKRAEPIDVPFGASDPGELRSSQVKMFCAQLQQERSK